MGSKSKHNGVFHQRNKKAGQTKGITSKRGKLGDQSDMDWSQNVNKSGIIYGMVVFGLALVFGYLHSAHVSSMFENERFFSHLSTLERELSFRTEMGLYYSYYKTIVEADTLSDGVHSIVHCNITEYPSEVNVLRRFNLYPELILGTSFRIFEWITEKLKLNTKICYTVNRGHGMAPVQSCEGMGDLAFFYVYPIFWLSGAMMSIFFLLGSYLSGSIFGGLVSVACYFYNHGEATRIMWTPPLRESFSFPLLIAQMLALVYTIKAPRSNWKHSVLLCVTTLCFMLPWQFAQFALLTQICALFALYMLKFIGREKFSYILYGLLGGHMFNFVFQFANTLLMSSFFVSAMITSLVIVKLEPHVLKLSNQLLIWAVQVVGFVIGTVCLKLFIAKAFHIKDDAHIFAILQSKFSDYKDFHTMLYTCAPEFDFIENETPVKLSKTLLLPCSIVCFIAVFSRIALDEWRRWTEAANKVDAEERDNEVEERQQRPYAEHLYLVLQALAFVVMSILIMRLKLFGTPALCLVCSLLASKEFFPIFKNHYQQQAVVVAILAMMSFQGVSNLKSQMAIKGEYNNGALEELVEWVNSNTPKDAVFAGAMPTMAAIKLSTKRAIVNHPHYEDAGLRQRTKMVYQLYSRKPVKEVYDTLKRMQVTHIVLEDSWCSARFKPGCGIPEVWDLEDPKNRDREPCCNVMKTNPNPFRLVFKNDVYSIFTLR